MSKREQILELVKEGEYTKAKIAEKVGMKPEGVSSQFTYLRWMGNNIAIVDGICKILSDEEYAEYRKPKGGGKKATSKLPVVERVRRLIVANKKHQMALTKLEENEPNENDPEILRDEWNAKQTILKAKIWRNEQQIDTLVGDNDDVLDEAQAQADDPNFEYVSESVDTTSEEDAEDTEDAAEVSDGEDLL
jgi:hypothetical protein